MMVNVAIAHKYDENHNHVYYAGYALDVKCKLKFDIF